MKKANRPTKQMVSKQTFQIAKSSSTDSPSKSQYEGSSSGGLPRNQPQEDNLMGEASKGSKSEAMDKNLNQMFDVLRLRLGSLDDVVKTRIMLSSHDPLENSKLRSDPSSKIVDEFDEVIPRSLREARPQASNVNRDNLVSSDTVHIDANHLVFSKLKPGTEAAKKLEMSIEESLGNFNIREMKNKKSKSLNQTEKSKKSEQLKNEAKRITRMKLEKQLQAVMDEDKTVVTRSVMDPDQVIMAPSSLHTPIEFPISVKWPARDPRSAEEGNNEGQFDPDLLLRYAIERMSLPSGKKMFSWLVRQSMVQNYFVHLFWLTKVKFFETTVREEVEAYLLRQLSIEYKNIMELLAERAHAEHEKDFAFKYFPFILTNGVYFAFFYLHPGSRHLYTRGFKKTIYMQIIQVMYGIQLCPSTVKVSWAKVFPEDTHEDGAEGGGLGGDTGGEDVGESFPIPMALKGPKGTRTMQLLPTSSSDDEVDRDGLLDNLDSAIPVVQVTTTPDPFSPQGAGARRGFGPSKGSPTHSQTNPNIAVTFTVDTQDTAGEAGSLAGRSLSSSQSAASSSVGRAHGGLSGKTKASNASSGAISCNDYYYEPDAAHAATAGFSRPHVAKGHLKGGFLSDQRPDFESGYEPDFPTPAKLKPAKATEFDANGKLTAVALAALVGIAGFGRVNNSSQRQGRSAGRWQMLRDQKSSRSLASLSRVPSMATAAGMLKSRSQRHLTPNSTKGGAGAIGSPSRTMGFPSARAMTPLSRVATPFDEASSFGGASTQLGGIPSEGGSDAVLSKTAVEEFAEDPKVNHSLARTYLRPPLEKPSDPRLISKRQNNQERLLAQLKSPQIQLHLSHLNGSAESGDEKHAQTFSRTVPISWCAAGGTDTHKKTVIDTELHQEISAKLKESMQDQYQEAIDLHKKKIKAVRENEKQLEKVLGSGPTMIGRFSLDLIRRQRALRGGTLTAKEASAAQQQPLVDADSLDMAEIQRLADYDDEELEQWLAEF